MSRYRAVLVGENRKRQVVRFDLKVTAGDIREAFQRFRKGIDRDFRASSLDLYIDGVLVPDNMIRRESRPVSER